MQAMAPAKRLCMLVTPLLHDKDATSAAGLSRERGNTPRRDGQGTHERGAPAGCIDFVIPPLLQNDRMARTIEVVGAVIVRDNLVYCVQRGPGGSLPGLWEFPGGKLEPGESEAAALTREIQEELLCDVKVGQKVTTTAHAYDFGTVRLTTYYCDLIAGEPSLTEHAGELWLRPDQLTDLTWAPADIPAVEVIVTQLAHATKE